MLKKIRRKYLKRLLKYKNKNYHLNILKQESLKKAHIYCKINKLSGQMYGPLIETYIIKKYCMTKNKSSDCTGDCSIKKHSNSKTLNLSEQNVDKELFSGTNVKENTKDNKLTIFDNNYKIINYEIKVSLGGMNHNKFNYVQLRMNHNIDYYILTAYYLNNNNLKNKGELFVFIIGKNELKNIIFKYGQYAHGTLNKNGKRTMEIMNDNDKNEYSIRPIYGDLCWNELLKYRVNEDNIFEENNSIIIDNVDEETNPSKKIKIQ
jgi:hypothetical protein